MHESPVDRVLGTVVAVGLGIAVLAGSPGVRAEVLKRVSVASDGAQGNGGSFAPAISPDGRFTAFVSNAPNLVPNDNNGRQDVFVNDRVTGTTTRVSVGPGGIEADEQSGSPSISANGQLVAFDSDGQNLGGCANGFTQVFLRDRAAGTTTCISVTGGGVAGNEASSSPSASADGRFIAFQSDADDLGSCSSGVSQIFVRDRGVVPQTTTCVSVTGGVAGNGGSSSPSASADGRFIAFQSDADDLGSCSSGVSQIFVRDRMAQTTTCVSVTGGGVAGNSGSSSPSVSADGRFIAFQSNADDLGSCSSAFSQIFVRDRVAQTTTCVSVTGAGVAGNLGSSGPRISADGRFVAFVSSASDLVASDTNGVADIFIRDRLAGGTTRVSVAPTGGGPQRFDNTTPLAIPDLWVVESLLDVSGVAGNVGKVTVSLRIAHTFDEDLRVTLVAPDGVTEVTLVANRGGGGDDFGTACSPDGSRTTFDDGAPTAVGSGAAPFAGSFRPEQALSAFVGKGGPDVNGTWRLRIEDQSLLDTGTLHCWSLLVTGNGEADLVTFSPAISNDGRLAVFASSASLTGVDTNGLPDVFVARLPAGPNWLLAAPAAPGAGAGLAPIAPGGALGAFDLNKQVVQGFDANGGTTLLRRAPYPGFGGAVRLAYGDVTGDGAPEVITAAGPGGGPHVRVFSDTTASTLLAEFFAYDINFRGGVFVAACDVDGNGKAEIITGAGAGGGPHVRIFTLTGNPASPIGELIPGGFFAYDDGFLGGVSVACGDVDATGRAAIVTGAGPGGGPHVRVFKFTGSPAAPVSHAAVPSLLQELAGFFAYNPAFLGGVRVAVGDLKGTGKAQVITGAGPGGGPHVRSFDVNPQLKDDASFFAYVPEFAGGVIVAAGETTGSGRAQIVTGAGPGGGPHVRTFDVKPAPLPQLPAVVTGDKSFFGSENQDTGIEVAAPPVGEGGGGGGL